MSIVYDDIYLNIPESWKGDSQIERFVSLLNLLSKRTGGGAEDNIATINDECTANTAAILANTSSISTNSGNITTNTGNITTLTLKNAILELLQSLEKKPKIHKDKTKYIAWGVL